MPIFEFHCQDCDNKFNLLISNNDKNKVKCPQCSSGNIKQLLSLFSTSRGKGAINQDRCNGCAERTRG
ncbi:MAG: zinc ribbon domain-containing protein [Syntrophomonadaceae bacterium]|jgi:putative FmdB family regulatory protein|nr:zinc ribbon domain-containing protein [Syntrophomonadaceae bacterium]